MPLPSAKLTGYERNRPETTFKIKPRNLTDLHSRNLDRKVKERLNAINVVFKTLGDSQFVTIVYRGERNDTQARQVLKDMDFTLL